MCCTRGILRWALIGGLALGGLTLLVGRDTVSAAFSQIRTTAQTAMGHFVDDPVALRRQLQKLADEYPDRIAKVRGELAEVDSQIRLFEDDREVAQRVVALTTNDLTELKTKVARAEAEAATTTRPVSIRFGSARYNVQEAYSEAARINGVRLNYQDRVATNDQQLAMLQQQQARLLEILNKLDTEYTTFQNQMWQMDRQIDSIERNERLIAMTEQLQATLQGYDKFAKVGNLRQLEGKLAELRAVQQAQLDALSKRGVHRDYESRALSELKSSETDFNPFADLDDAAEGAVDTAPAPSQGKGKVAFLDPIVIE